MDKKITIIVLGNNKIEETIRSLENQVYKEIEIFMSSDNSKFKSKKLNQRFFEEKEFYEDNNKLNFEILRKIESNYFTILNSGDTVGLDFYRQLIENGQSKDSEMIMGNTVFENEGNRWVYNLLDSSISKMINNDVIKEYIDKKSKLCSILKLPGNKIISTNIINKIDKSNIDDLDINILKSTNSITKIDVDALFHKISVEQINGNKKNNYCSVISNWDYAIEVMKEEILNDKIQYVSFDVFDTLIVRPFLEPRDEMYLINPILNSYYPNGLGMNFVDIRGESEFYAREKHSEQQDINLDQIYDAMKEVYRIDDDIANKLKNKEIENEIKFCSKRKTSYDVYSFAKYIGKKIIVISDMYLGKDVIEKMVKKCGYDEIDKFYISSECKKTKASGDLYDYVVDDLNVLPENIIHIGDNWQSDWKNSNDHGINGQFLPRTINRLYDTNLGKIFFKSLPFMEDNRASTNFLIIRCMLAMVANKYFDNPWKRYDEKSIFNGDVALFGYYALGMNLYGIVKWLLDELNQSSREYKRIEFMARDGFLPQAAYEKMKFMYDDSKMPKSDYFYISRKALIPLIFTSPQHCDIYKLIGSMNIFNHTPIEIIKYLGKNVDNDRQKIEKICKEIKIEVDKPFKNVYSFDIFLNEVREKLLDKENAKAYYEKIKKYFKEIFEDEACTFDIGYSARPELLISKMCGKPVDAFFINVNEQSAYENANLGEFTIKTFLDYKPVVTGSIREILISKQAPSCIGYECVNEKVIPVFEEYDRDIDEWNTINVIQENALNFIEDMVTTFGSELNKFEYYKYYTNIPLDLFINSPGEADKKILQIIDFEDGVGMGDNVGISEYLDKERAKYNQFRFEDLLENKKIDTDNMEVFDLKNRNRCKKLIYYILFKPEKLKNKKIFKIKK